MQLRGEFRRADGLVIPNNVTLVGARRLLQLALLGADAPADGFYVGLCSCVFTPGLDIGDIEEPTIGSHGYARQLLNRNATDWPGTGVVNDQRYLESKNLGWAATGANFDKGITRMFICFDAVATTGPVFALSAALPTELVITPATDVNDRTFKYRLYTR